jgi:Zn-dependent protease
MNWTWFIVAYFQIRYHPLHYTTPIWKVAEYLTLFGIVLVHEFGHSLACRQVGGIANQIVLWPLGGVAYVNPPARPGAYLWSIVAGPLVNVILVPVTLIPCVLFVGLRGLQEPLSDFQEFVFAITIMNFALLVFNLLPIYPLDGGQIVRALLWFLMGPARSLMAVTLVGTVVGGVAVILALLAQRWWLTALAIFAVMRSITGFQLSRRMMKPLNVPKREGFACPSCDMAPPQGDFWKCSRCQTLFDIFLRNGTCPSCGGTFTVTQCLNCGQRHLIDAWRATAV